MHLGTSLGPQPPSDGEKRDSFRSVGGGGGPGSVFWCVFSVIYSCIKSAQDKKILLDSVIISHYTIINLYIDIFLSISPY